MRVFVSSMQLPNGGTRTRALRGCVGGVRGYWVVSGGVGVGGGWVAGWGEYEGITYELKLSWPRVLLSGR